MPITRKKPTANEPTKPSAKNKKMEGTQIRVATETHRRFRDLAKTLGVSQIALLRTLSFAKTAEYVKCEQRRLAGGSRSDES